MAKLTNDYIDYAMHKVIVDALASDGAVCNSNTKDYDVAATYNGGTGFRLSFTRYNQKIIEYHAALKVLLGIQRANIYESIPVIDYMNPNNTSFMYTYKVNDNGIDTTSIYSAGENGQDDLYLIEHDDPFTINRAIVGQSMAEHFYNARQNSGDMNLQTSPWLGSSNVEFIYHGVKDNDMYVEGDYIEATPLKSPIYSVRASKDVIGLDGAYITNTARITYKMDALNSTISIPSCVNRPTINGDIIRDIHGTFVVDSSKLTNSSYKKLVQVDGRDFISSETGNSGRQYTINLEDQDICIAIPRTTYSDDGGLSKLLVYKYSPSSAIKSLGQKYWGHYKVGDEEIKGNSIKDLTQGVVGDTYYLLPYPENATEITDPIPSHLQYNTEIQLNQALNVNATPGSGEATSVTGGLWDPKTNNYKLFIIPVSSYSSTKTLTQSNPEDKLPDYLSSLYIYQSLKNYLDTEKIYTAEASGLLNGLYCEPYKRTSSDISSKVTEWKLIDDQEEAKKRGVSVDIGAKYYRGHLLGRGIFDAEPLKLTPNDTKQGGPAYNKNFKGKAETIYDALQDAASNLFDRYQVNNFNNFSLRSIDDVITKADYAGITYSMSEAKDLLGIDTNSSSYAYSSILNYPNKLKQSSSKPATIDNILQYINDCLDNCTGDDVNGYTLDLDCTDEQGPCVWTRYTHQKYSYSYTYDKVNTKKKCGKEVVTGTEKVTETSHDIMHNTEKHGEASEIYNKIGKNFSVTYNVDFKELTQEQLNSISSGSVDPTTIQQQDGEIYGIGIKLITPLETFSTKNISVKNEYYTDVSADYKSAVAKVIDTHIVPKGTVLVYPEYSKYYPETLLLLSNTNLGLDAYSPTSNSQRSMLNLITGNKADKVISFRVAEVKSFKPSKIKRVILKTQDGNKRIEYPYGLYPVQQEMQENYVVGFEEQRVRASSTYITNSRGQKFRLDDVAAGKYILNNRDNITGRITGRNLKTGLSVQTLKKSSVKIAKARAAAQARLQSLQNETGVSTKAPAPIDSADFELGPNKIKIDVSNQAEIKSREKLQKVLKNAQSPIYGVWQQPNANIVDVSIKRNHDYRHKETKVTTISEDIRPVMLGGGGSDDGPTNISKVIEVNYEYENNYGAHGHKQQVKYYTVRTPILETRYIYNMSEGTEYDCYIYVLKPMQLALSNLVIYDQEDNKIDLGANSDIDIIPMSYPKNYFDLTSSKSTDGTVIHKLKNRSDIKSLKHSYIVPGLPRKEGESYESTLRAKNKWRIDLNSIANMMYSKDSTVASTLSSIIGNVMYQIFSNWKLSGLGALSATTLNPLRFNEFVPLVEGLVELKPILTKLTTAGFRIASSATKGEVTITEDMLAGMLARIDQDSIMYANIFDFGNPKIIVNSDFKDDLKSSLGDDWVLSSEESSQVTRPSLKTLAGVVSRTLGPGSKITRSVCKEIDRYFGNGTKPFLIMGGSEVLGFESKGESFEFGLNADLDRAINNVEDKITNTIYKRAYAAKQAYIDSQADSYNLSNNIEAVYKTYYKSDSVDKLLDTLNKGKFGIDVDSYNNAFTADDIDVNKLLQTGKLKDIYEKIKNTLEASNILWALRWSRMSYESWITSLNLDNKSSNNNYKGLLGMLRLKDLQAQAAWVISRALKAIRDTTKFEIDALILKLPEINKDMPTRDQVTKYLRTPNNEGLVDADKYLSNNNLWYGVNRGKIGKSSSGQTYITFNIWVVLPEYDPETNTFKPYKNLPITSLEDSWKLDLKNPEDYAYVIRKQIKVYSEEISDVSENVLAGVAEFVKTSLEGTGKEAYYVKYVEGDNSTTGRSNSLYYKRYQMLNNRLNLAYGTLAGIIPLIRNNNITQISKHYSDNLIESYKGSLDMMPISKMEPLSYMPAQEATATTIELPGKFYYQAELEALRAEISGKCILTCSKCSVQSSCPFYNAEEIIKMYCTPAETIDLYVKDNELDLIEYVDLPTTTDDNEEEIIHYPHLVCTDIDGQYETLDIEKLKRTHEYYNGVLKKEDSEGIENYEGVSISEIAEELDKAPYFNKDIDGKSLGFLLGGRYGTVRKNGMAALANSDEDFKEFNGVKLPEYQYLYDVMHIEDEETYVNYSRSDHTYKVSLQVGPNGAKKTYTGETYIKIPTSLKVLANANRSDYVYLISDDNTDGQGTRILPVVYLGQVGNIQYSFGIDTNNELGVLSANDKNIYAQDIAQWCINYYKGHCTEDPIGDIGPDPSAPTKPMYSDMDQYWMPELKKYIAITNKEQGITEGWITVEGRPRESSGYQEPVMDPDNFSEIDVVAGKPVALDYKNFLRRVSIRIYDSSKAHQFDDEGNLLDDEAWLIPWVKDLGPDGTKTLKNGLVISKETQKAALAHMKTNLRMVIVKNKE